MIGFCHQDNTESLFVCKSSFVPTPEPILSSPQQFEPPPPIKQTTTYLPGERLLIKLGKEKQKKKEKTIDIDRVVRSLVRILT